MERASNRWLPTVPIIIATLLLTGCRTQRDYKIRNHRGTEVKVFVRSHPLSKNLMPKEEYVLEDTYRTTEASIKAVDAKTGKILFDKNYAGAALEALDDGKSVTFILK